jgi:hypothetical protein
MSRIHYFQRYSQRENVITNNTLLLLGRLYQYRPVLLESVLNTLLAGDDEANQITVGITMKQQDRGSTGGIPDGVLDQQSLRVLIETKRGTDFGSAQIMGHVKRMGDSKRPFLVMLGKELLPSTELEEIRKEVKGERSDAILVNTTFDRIIKAVDDELDEWEQELRELLEDYREYCSSEKLLPDEYSLRAVLCGKTITENIRFGVYYNEVGRNYADHSYLGLYDNKAVRALGKVVKVFSADIGQKDTMELVDTLKGAPPTQKELDLITEVMNDAVDNPGYDIRVGHRFYLVDGFYPTEFTKDTKYALMHTQYFDLREFLTVPGGVLPGTEDIANQLRGKKWSDAKPIA